MGGSSDPPSPFLSIGIGPKTSKCSLTTSANCSCCSFEPLMVGISNTFLSMSGHRSSPISMPSDSGSYCSDPNTTSMSPVPFRVAQPITNCAGHPSITSGSISNSSLLGTGNAKDCFAPSLSATTTVTLMLPCG